MPHISTKRNNQNPRALCRSQLKRFHPLLHFTPRLRFQRDTPGHHTTRPVKTVSVNTALNAPFQYLPVRSNRSSSCSRASQRTKYSPCVTESPRSAPEYGLNRAFFLRPPARARTRSWGYGG